MNVDRAPGGGSARPLAAGPTLQTFTALILVIVAASVRAEDERHWAYRPVTRPAAPPVKNADRVRTPVDAFLLKRLEQEQQTCAAPANRRDLLRRVTFDLTGLPPTPEEMDAFLNDPQPNAYDRVVERLLASPHYGERWGRLWLDVVRYADTAGYNADPLRPLAWKYRDYVIRAFNDDVPFDRFVQEQIAGDELFPDRADAVIATGFLRLPPDESNASNVELARQDLLNDITANIGSIFLAQSFGCAQCHDHKFDAISQADFYRLQAFFSGLVWVDELPVGTPRQLAEYRSRLDRWLADTAALRHELIGLELPVRMKVTAERRMKFPAVVLGSLDALPEERTALQLQLSFFAERQIDLKEPELLKAMSPDLKARREALRAELARREQERPQPPAKVAAMVATDGRDTPKAYRLNGGSYNKPAEEAPPAFPEVIDFTGGAPDLTPPSPRALGRRTALARWLTDPRNPLVARVLVNRIWQGHFGRGLVENANDFGTQTPQPSHPELLDWLAAELVSPSVDSGPAWTLKRLHRLILLSEAYRQSSGRVTDEAFVYQSYPRRRLEGEVIRDAMLSVSGGLNARMFGPGVQPEVPAGYSGREAWKVSDDPAERRRRSVYILAKRNLPYPLLQAFDLPDMHESCACRTVTTTAPQALLLLNSELTLGYARAFAGRLLADSPDLEPPELVRRAWRLALSREPSADELAVALEFLAKSEMKDTAGRADALPRPFPKFFPPARAAALVDLCHALFNTNEFVYVD